LLCKFTPANLCRLLSQTPSTSCVEFIKVTKYTGRKEGGGGVRRGSAGMLFFHVFGRDDEDLAVSQAACNL